MKTEKGKLVKNKGESISNRPECERTETVSK